MLLTSDRFHLHARTVRSAPTRGAVHSLLCCFKVHRSPESIGGVYSFASSTERLSGVKLHSGDRESSGSPARPVPTEGAIGGTHSSPLAAHSCILAAPPSFLRSLGAVTLTVFLVTLWWQLKKFRDCQESYCRVSFSRITSRTAGQNPSSK